MECVSRDQLGPASSVLVLCVLVLLVSLVCVCVVYTQGEGGAFHNSVAMVIRAYSYFQARHCFAFVLFLRQVRQGIAGMGRDVSSSDFHLDVWSLKIKLHTLKYYY